MAQPRIEARTLIPNLIISPFQGLISKSGFVHQDFILTLIIKPFRGMGIMGLLNRPDGILILNISLARLGRKRYFEFVIK